MMKSFNSISSRFDQILERIEKNSAVGDIELSCFRIFLGIFILFFLVPSWSWLAELPSVFFNPQKFNISRAFDGFLAIDHLIFLDVLFYSAVFLFTVGIFTRQAFLFAFLVAILGNSFAYSLGKINHDFMLWFLLIVMAFSNSGSALAIKKQKKISSGIQKTALGVYSLALVFALFSAGIHKLLQWVDFDLSTSGFLRWFYNGYFDFGRTELLADLVLILPPVIVEIFDYSAVAFEITGIFFLVFGRQSWRIYLLFATIFHIFNALLLNIPFSIHIPVYGLFLLSPLLAVLVKKTSPVPNIIKLVLIFALLLRTLAIVFSEKWEQLMPKVVSFWHDLAVGLAAWLLLLLVALYSFARGLYGRQPE